MSPPADPSSQPPVASSRRDEALDVVRRLREAGHVAYFAGGCVRDELKGREPKDYDVATDAPPARVAGLFRHTQAVGAAFGVTLVRSGRSQIEVATFRADGHYADGRHPEAVRFASAEEDAKRRDFTMNALFLDPLDGRVIDYVGGRADLERGVLRAVGDPAVRFEEDYLRVLRAIRFASRFDLMIDAATADAVRRAAPRLKSISPERVAGELRMMLPPPSRARASDLLWDFGVVSVVFRTLPASPQSPPPGQSGLSSRRVLARLRPGQPISFPLSLAALLLAFRSDGDGNPPLALFDRREVRRAVQACRATLKISNEESAALEGILDLAPLLGEPAPGVAATKRFLATPTSSDARALLDALDDRPAYASRIDWLRDRFETLLRSDVAPRPLLNGDDLTTAGFQPGPQFKRVLEAVYDAQLEDRVATASDAMAMARGLFST